jgi:chromosome segregation ATPase
MSDIEDRLRLRSEECDLLRSDLRSSTEELVVLQGRLRESRDSLSSLTSEIIPLRHAVKTSEKKRELLENQLGSVQKTLAGKKNELDAMMRDNAESTSDLQIKLRAALSDLERSKCKQQSLEDTVETQNERIDAFICTISELEAANVKRTAELERSIDQKSASSQQYKHLYEDALLKVEGLQAGNAALQQESSHFEERMRELELTMEESRKTSESVVEKLSVDRKALLEKLKCLEQETNELQQQQQQQVVPLSTHGSSSSSSFSRRKSGVSIVDIVAEEGLFDAQELYERLVSAQEAVSFERSKRKEAEQYLGRIHRDLELKGPVITKMKSDHSLLLHAHDSRGRQLDSVLRENSILRDQVAQMHQLGGGGKVGAEVTAVLQQNKDLSSQITQLLSEVDPGAAAAAAAAAAGSMVRHTSEEGEEEEDEAMELVSSRLVKFGTVAELQKRNMQLLQVVRRLAINVADGEEAISKTTPLADLTSMSTTTAGGGGGGGGNTASATVAATTALSRTLTEALDELQNMRESRAKAESVLLDVMAERDQLKTLLAPTQQQQQQQQRKGGGAVGTHFGTSPGRNNSSSSSSSTSPSSSSSSSSEEAGSSSPSSPGRRESNNIRAAVDKATTALHSIVAQLEARLTSSTSRIEQAQKEHESIRGSNLAQVSQLRAEAASLQARFNEASSSVRSLQEELSRSRSESKAATGEVRTAAAALVDTELKLAEQRRQVAALEAQLHTAQSEATTAAETQKFIQIELELSQASEASALEQLAAVEEERKKEGLLLESVHRVERELVLKKEGEVSGVARERDELSKEVAKLRKELLDIEIVSSARVMHLEGELKRCSVVAEEKVEEAFQLRLGYVFC